jgi:glycosyltransferase involved in cell wall biosynthesis
MSRFGRRTHDDQRRRDLEAGTHDRQRSLSTLQLVTTPRPFFTEQIRALERCGIDSTMLSVPGTSRSRSVTDFLQYYPSVLRRALRSGEWDVVHANFGLVAPHALCQPVRPVVLSLWGTDLMGKYGAVSRWCAKRCDAVVVMSEEMAAELDTDCHVIPHGIDLRRFAPRPRRDARADLGWSHDAKHVLFPYAPDREVKNYPRAERVVAETRERIDEPIELHAVDGLAHGEIPTYMNAADVLLMTSRREGSPNAIKEALACGLPVVATDVGDVPDRLADVYPSYVCADDAGLASALETVFDLDVRSNGRETVEDASLERMGERLCDVYASVGVDV